jgi:hypothetical protein
MDIDPELFYVKAYQREVRRKARALWCTHGDRQRRRSASGGSYASSSSSVPASRRSAVSNPSVNQP